MPNTLKGQSSESSINQIKVNSISFSLLGAPTVPIGVSYGQMLTNRISYEMGVGIQSSGAGVTYYLTNPRNYRLNIYTGFFASINYDGFGSS